MAASITNRISNVNRVLAIAWPGLHGLGRNIGAKIQLRRIPLDAKTKAALYYPSFWQQFTVRSHVGTGYRGLCTEAEHPISRFPTPDIDGLPQDMQDLIRDVEEKSGFVPNVFKALAHRPAEFRAFFAYYDALMAKETGSLTKADKEMIVVATSSYNNCLYCIIAHSALFRIYSKNRFVADQVAANWEIAELTPRQRAILEFAMAVCKSQSITEEHFVKLEQHGLDREDAWDIGAISAFFALSNRMAHLTDMRPNKEFYLLGRVPKETK